MRIAVNETTLYFDVEGAGLVPDGPVLRERPVIVALHGGPGFDHAYFKPFLSELTDTAQIVYLDLRGQGRSDRPPVETCTLEQMADDVAAFCRALGIERPTILGHSAGGFVALTLVARHPETAGRLILVDTVASTAEPEGAMDTLERRRGTEARTVAERLFGGERTEEMGEAFNRLAFPVYAHDPATAGPVFAAVGRSAFNPEVAAFYFGTQSGLYDRRGSLGGIRVPTLAIVGESDWLVSQDASSRLAAAIPGAEHVVVPAAGHFAFAEQPERFAAAVRKFLAA